MCRYINMFIKNWNLYFVKFAYDSDIQNFDINFLTNKLEILKQKWNFNGFEGVKIDEKYLIIDFTSAKFSCSYIFTWDKLNKFAVYWWFDLITIWLLLVWTMIVIYNINEIRELIILFLIIPVLLLLLLRFLWKNLVKKFEN